MKVANELSEHIGTKLGFRQGDSPSYNFFNILMEKIIRSAGPNHSGPIPYKCVMSLEYADDLASERSVRYSANLSKMFKQWVFK